MSPIFKPDIFATVSVLLVVKVLKIIFEHVVRIHLWVHLCLLLMLIHVLYFLVVEIMLIFLL